MKFVWVFALLPQRLKSTLKKNIFSSFLWPFNGHLAPKNSFKNPMISAFEKKQGGFHKLHFLSELSPLKQVHEARRECGACAQKALRHGFESKGAFFSGSRAFASFNS